MKKFTQKGFTKRFLELQKELENACCDNCDLCIPDFTGHDGEYLSNVDGVLTWQAISLGGYTPGSVLFANDSGNIGQDNANFFWNDTDNRLGICTEFPTETLYVKGSFLATSLTSSNTFINYQQILESGIGAAAYITQGNGKWGLSIQRASANGGAPYLNFYKNHASDFSTKTPAATVGGSGGTINWMSPGNDGNIYRSTSILQFYESFTGGGLGLPNTGLVIYTTGPNLGAHQPAFWLSADGQIRVGGVGGLTEFFDITDAVRPAQTADTSILRLRNTSRTFDTTSGNLTSYGLKALNTSTKSAGGNTLTNVAVYGDATGADVNYAGVFERGKVKFGLAGSQTATLELLGTTSGLVTVKPADAAGTWTMTLPTTDGNADEFLQTNGSGVTSWQPIPAQFTQGNYTPTLTNVTNLDSSTATVTHWYRVGDNITVYGKVTVDPTAAGATELGFELPLTSAFGNDRELGGVAASDTITGEAIAIKADTTNGRAAFVWNATDTASHVLRFQFSYFYTAP